jgi:hypothetical protein
VEKAQILAEIRRTAEENEGKPLGKSRFAAATGIREHDWRGRYWARWNDALDEAGFPPNVLQGRYDDALVLDSLISEIKARGRMPTVAELNLRRRDDPDFPSPRVFERLGPKAKWAAKVAGRCEERSDYADVLAIVEPLAEQAEQAEASEQEEAEVGELGAVYLLKSGDYYKVGRSNSVGRRTYELAIQLPEEAVLVHEIRTDDPAGIERYWHTRFGERRKNGEWFELTRADVSAFKRRKFQ